MSKNNKGNYIYRFTWHKLFPRAMTKFYNIQDFILLQSIQEPSPHTHTHSKLKKRNAKKNT